MNWRFIPPALATFVLASCDATRPQGGPLLPDKAAPGRTWAAQDAGHSMAEPVAWLEQFDDPAMRSAVREAVKSNPDLAAAASRMRQARIRAVREGAARLPTVSAGMRSGESGAGADSWNFETDYGLSLDVVWEADVWARLRDRTQASAAEAQAAEADFAAARLSLAANAARAWCNLLEASQQVTLAEQSVGTFRKGLQTVDSNYNKGVPNVTALDVRLARTSLASGESNLQSRLRARDAARRNLEALLGRYPAGVLDAGGKFPALRREVPVGLPGSLLLRRPDIQAAERRVAAAYSAEAAARKALLPSIRLTGGLRTASGELSSLLDERKLIASLVQSLAQPVYAGGALKAAVILSEEQRREVAARYAATALDAFREVETALAAERYIAGQIAAQEVFVKESAEAERLAMSQYERGLTDILRVLESQRRAFDSRSGLLRAQNQLLQARIDLCLALGGGF